MNQIECESYDFTVKPPEISMCSITESETRELTCQLNILEQVSGSNYNYDPNRTLKKYSHSELYNECNRNQLDLLYSLEYLFNLIIDLDTNKNPYNYKLLDEKKTHSFSDIYQFVFDRVRAIVKDWKIIQLKNRDFIQSHEKIARFLLISFVDGSGEDGFCSNFNFKLLEDVLFSLISAYQENICEYNQDPTNFAEFFAYFIVCFPDNKIQIERILRESPELLERSIIQSALVIFKGYYCEEYLEMMQIVRSFNFLMRCACFPLLCRVRLFLLEQLHRSTNRVLKLTDFHLIFGFHSEEDARIFIEKTGLIIKRNTFDGSDTEIVVIKAISNELYSCEDWPTSELQRDRPKLSRLSLVHTNHNL